MTPSRSRAEQDSAHVFLMSNPYAYLTVYKQDEPLCEGTVRSLSRLVNFSELTFKSFFTMYTEDGGIEIEAAI